MKKSDVQGFLESTAKGAGKILTQYFQKVKRIEVKKGAGVVTEADKKAEDYILRNISRKFPKSSIITEETGEYRGNDELCWIIDPLDGTTNYAHGFPWFCVSIALYQKNKPLAGVIYQPLFRDLYFAQAGKGAWHNGERIRVTKEKRIQNSLLGTGFYYFQGSQLKAQMKYFVKANEVARGVRRPGSAALDLAFVASGRYDGFWEVGLQCWDVAAGFLLVKEAGGRITNLEGKKTSIFDGNVVASNGGIHSQLLRAVGYRSK